MGGFWQSARGWAVDGLLGEGPRTRTSCPHSVARTYLGAFVQLGVEPIDSARFGELGCIDSRLDSGGGRASEGCTLKATAAGLRRRRVGSARWWAGWEYVGRNWTRGRRRGLKLSLRGWPGPALGEARHPILRAGRLRVSSHHPAMRPSLQAFRRMGALRAGLGAGAQELSGRRAWRRGRQAWLLDCRRDGAMFPSLWFANVLFRRFAGIGDCCAPLGSIEIATAVGIRPDALRDHQHGVEVDVQPPQLRRKSVVLAIEMYVLHFNMICLWNGPRPRGTVRAKGFGWNAGLP